MQLIEEFETIRRGAFSGSAGYIEPNGDFDFNVIIRSLLYHTGNGYLSLMAAEAAAELRARDPSSRPWSGPGHWAGYTAWGAST